MFSLETQILLNRFRCQAQLGDSERAEEQEKPSTEDRARRTEREKDRADYVENGERRIRDWERRISGR
ncbi:hypothetical protein [Bradyrhizobium tunisiense]|uniref:hypothetical protein n=1 Tax=Bradyrhizobium tunisiense TaxID=3278709 RepID=UPI0035D62D62